MELFTQVKKKANFAPKNLAYLELIEPQNG